MAHGIAEAAMRYHEATKHSEVSLRMSAHYLDWENRPSPFKFYENQPSVALPHEFPRPLSSSLPAVKTQNTGELTSIVDVDVLAEVLFFSAGLTRKMRLGSEAYYMRAASATGALYPIELYVVAGNIPRLEAGVYHFNPLNFTLVRLRSGDYRPQLASVSDETAASCPLTIVFTSIAWRNSWKYESRSYRHWFWDSGVIAANLLAICSAQQLSVKVAMGFVDAEIDRLLGLKDGIEAPIALARIGPSTGGQSGVTGAIPEVELMVEPLSREEDEYPIVWEMNKASELRIEKEVNAWRKGLALSKPWSAPQYEYRKYSIDSQGEDSSLSLSETILRRGSSRRFAQKSISWEELSSIIAASSGAIPLDFLPEPFTLIHFYFISNDVEGLPSGAYYYNGERRSLEQLKTGKLRHMSGYLCLDQPLFSDASAVFFLMTPLENVLRHLGNRGYRAAQFEAGIRAGKIYLAAYSLRLGASGSTFYDDAVTEFFSPHAKDMSAMIAVGVGVPAYTAKPGKILPQFTKTQQPLTVR